MGEVGTVIPESKTAHNPRRERILLRSVAPIFAHSSDIRGLRE